jgi:hypothetical protein
MCNSCVQHLGTHRFPVLWKALKMLRKQNLLKVSVSIVTGYYPFVYKKITKNVIFSLVPSQVLFYP